MHPVLRDYLLENVAPSEVWEALQLALRGSNESARVSAARLLLDALHQEQKEKQHDAWVADAAADFDRRLADGIKRHREIVAGMLRTDHPAHPGNQAHGPFHDGSGWGMMIELLRLGEVERQYLAFPEGVRNQFLLEAEPSDEPESTVRRATALRQMTYRRRANRLNDAIVETRNNLIGADRLGTRQERR